MVKLIKAEFKRCFSGRVFWLMVLFTFVLAVSCNIIRLIDVRVSKEKEVFNDSMLYIGLLIAGLLVVVFVSFYTGPEFDGGTIRNKLIAGNTKAEIYLCNLAVCSAVSVILQYVFFFTVYVFSNMFFGAFHHPFSVMMKLQLIGSLGVVAVTAIIILIMMIVRGAAVTMVVGMIAAILSFAMSVCVINTLEEHSECLFYTEEGYLTDEQYEVLNEHSYIYGVDSEECGGAKLFIYEALYDGLPVSQAYRFSAEKELPYHWQYMIIYDIAIIVIATAAGVLVFRKLNLK